MKAKGGFVLAVVLFAIVMLAALMAGGFFAALQEVRAGGNAQGSVRARGAAETAMWAAIAQWNPAVINAVAIGAVVAVTPPAMAGMTTVASVRRLSDLLFLVQSSATAPGGASSAVATVVRLSRPETTPAAVRARSLGAGLTGFSSGIGQDPAGWNCPASNDTVPDVLLQPGVPDSIFFRFGAMNWAALAAWAGAVAPGGDSLMVRYEPGDATLSGGRTVGLLVVGGNLTLTAGARHVGLVIVRGTLLLDGAGGSVAGAIVASQVIAVNGFMALTPAVVWSGCAVNLASGSRAPPVTLQGLPPSGFF